MADFATYADVQARIPYRTIDGSSSPTATQVEGYITQAEHALSGALLGGGCELPETTDDGADILKMWIVNYAEGVTRQAYAAAGGDGGNDDGQELIDGFMDLLDKIHENPATYCAMINGGAAPGDDALRVRGYVLDKVDNDDYDIGPDFDRDTELQ